jgi:hypothetical protein
MGEHPEMSVFPMWVPSPCYYPGALILGMALSLGIYPKLIGASKPECSLVNPGEC